MMTPVDERSDIRVITLGNRLNAAVGPVGHPATETQLPRYRDRRGTKSDTLDTSHDAQPFAYDHSALP